MRRPVVALVALFATACVTHRALPVRYDLEASPSPVRPDPRLNATIAIAPIQAPSWLSTTALLYRLDYEAPARLSPYTRSAWTAPPSELLTLRLRQRISAANDGFTLERLPSEADGYQLRITLEDFTQVFQTPHHSQCRVRMSATLIRRGGEVLAQRTFRTTSEAPTADAAGAVEGLLDASDSNLAQIVAWLHASVPTRSASAAATAH